MGLLFGLTVSQRSLLMRSTGNEVSSLLSRGDNISNGISTEECHWNSHGDHCAVPSQLGNTLWFSLGISMQNAPICALNLDRSPLDKNLELITGYKNLLERYLQLPYNSQHYIYF